jgi:hypothetical protein
MQLFCGGMAASTVNSDRMRLKIKWMMPADTPLDNKKPAKPLGLRVLRFHETV